MVTAIFVVMVCVAAVGGWFWLATGSTPAMAMAALAETEPTPTAAPAVDLLLAPTKPSAAARTDNERRAPAPSAEAAKSAPAVESPGRKELTAGRTYLATGRPAAAVPLLEEAVRLSPEDADAHYRLALAYVATKDLEGARREQLVLAELDRNLASLLGNLMR